MSKNRDVWWKIAILFTTIAITESIHYGWVLQPLFGHANWIHAIHSRLCYIPIVIAASWFGLRGGLWTALAISALALPYIFIVGGVRVNVPEELLEIVFYFAIATLTGALVDRETKIRLKQEQTQLQLEKAHKLSIIGQMAAGIAHEIKNPLASVKGAFEILCDNTTTREEKKEFQDIVFKEIKRIDDTVTEFLEFARSKDFKLKKLNLSENIESVLRQMQNQVSNAGVKLKTDIENNIYIAADPQKIRQVIINLVLNAIDVSSPGNTIEVSVSADNHKAYIVFIDEGQGLSADEAEKIFEPFYTTKAKGIGLGLAIIRSIVERHNGAIKVGNSKGKGAEFTIVLPLYKER